MNKKLVIIIVLVSLIVISYFYINNKKTSYDPAKAESLGVSDTVSYFKKCKTSSDPFVRYLCPEITDADLYKLEAIQYLNANKLCSFNTSQNKTEVCSLDGYTTTYQEIWKFNYTPALKERITTYTIRIVESKGNYFFVREGYSDDKREKTDVFILEKLDKEIVALLKEYK